MKTVTALLYPLEVILTTFIVKPWFSLYRQPVSNQRL